MREPDRKRDQPNTSREPGKTRVTLGEIRLDNDRFPGLVLEVDGKRYLIDRADASRFGQRMADGARNAVSRVDVEILRPVVVEAELTPL